MAKAQIVVVEDEGLVALEIKEGLENMGYEVPYVFSSGEEALAVMESDKPDLVLMDIRIEGKLDGIETAKIIRRNFEIPIIFLTAHSDEKTLQRAKVTESYGYLLKPFEDRALKAAIEIALFKAHEERKLKGSKNWLDIILRCIGEGVLVCDIKGEVKFVNETATSVLGQEDASLIGKRLNQVFTVYEADSGSVKTIPLTKVIMQGETVSEEELRLKDQNEEFHTVNYSLAPLRNEKSIIIGIVIVFKETTTDKEQQHIKDQLNTPVKLQKSLLPENNSSIFGIKSSYLFYPSTYGAGDLLNFFSLDEKHIGFYLLDVMGHGFSASLISLTLHKFLSPSPVKGGIVKRKTEGIESRHKRRKSDMLPDIISPGRVITELNKRFYFETNDNPFFTILYGIIDTSTNKVTIARGGHLFPLLQRAGCKPEKIQSKGYAVGIFPEMEVEEKEFRFEKGDRLFLFSDGLTETTNQYLKEYSGSKVEEFLDINRDYELEDLVQLFEQDIISWRGKRLFEDDVAFLAMERQ